MIAPRPLSRYVMGAHNWGAVLIHFHGNTWMGYPHSRVRQSVERVVEDSCHPAVRVIAGRLVSSDGQHMEKRGARQGPFLFDGIGSKHYQGHRLQAPEDRVSNRRPAGLCSFDFDWRGRPVAHPLVKPQGSWLLKQGKGGHCTTGLEERWEIRRVRIFSFLPHITDD